LQDEVDELDADITPTAGSGSTGRV